MRLDDDSQLLEPWPNVFEIMAKKRAIYMANHKVFDYEYILPGILRIRNFTTEYILQNKIVPQNPTMIADMFLKPQDIPVIYNNFEIVETSFMQRNDIRHFINAVDETHYIFLYRWALRIRQHYRAPAEFITTTSDDKHLIIFSKFHSSDQISNHSLDVIIFLVASYSGDVRTAFNPYPRLHKRIAQLGQRLNDNNVTDIIIFHTGYPFRADYVPIFDVTPRHVEFVNVDHLFNKFPRGFEPHRREPTWSQRGKWNYHHMCYFWFKQVFELKILHRYRYMMRLDDDSQLLESWPNVFEIMAKKRAIYMANQKETDFEIILRGTTIVRDLLTIYVNKSRIVPQNPTMFAEIYKRRWEVPVFWNNFEIIETSFMRRNEVIDFIHTVDESQGIFLYRWGDALLRFITLALFTNESQILHRVQLNFTYCHPC
ncbi:unnamed protein product [Adineta ricciae]|uniref:Uncharacterized protein n=1 Tax=Adineta ricciae TaxID=249248 RepID=A0A814RSJ6_ADIRI|nr:unnamed protein product [Adineta ricciae]